MKAEPGSKFHAVWLQILRFKRSLKLIAFVAFVGLTAEVLFNISSRPEFNDRAIAEARTSISTIEKNVGIIVKYEAPYTLRDGSPPAREGVMITYDPLNLKLLPLVAQGLKITVTPYPDGFLQKYCGLILVTGNLKVNGRKAGGTYGAGWIVVDVQQKDHLSNEMRLWAIQRAFHHECASQIYDNDAWAMLAFMSAWPKDIIPSKYIDVPTSFDPSIGFVSSYSMTGSSNDFSEYVRFIFSEPKKIRDLAMKHSKVREKLDIVMASYERADPRFRDYFDAQGLIEVSE